MRNIMASHRTTSRSALVTQSPTTGQDGWESPCPPLPNDSLEALTTGIKTLEDLPEAYDQPPHP
jgi:hypothetical protein